MRAISWVLADSEAEGTDRLVLLVLAIHHHGVTDECAPGQRRIAREARIAQSTTSRSVARLVNRGDVEVERGRGRTPTRYRFPQLSTSDSDAPRGDRNGSVSDAPRRDREDFRSDPPDLRSDPFGRRSDPSRAEQIGNRNSDRGRGTDAPPIGVGPALPTRTAREIREAFDAIDAADPALARDALDRMRRGIGRTT